MATNYMRQRNEQADSQDTRRSQIDIIHVISRGVLKLDSLPRKPGDSDALTLAKCFDLEQLRTINAGLAPQALDSLNICGDAIAIRERWKTRSRKTADTTAGGSIKERADSPSSRLAKELGGYAPVSIYLKRRRRQKGNPLTVAGQDVYLELWITFGLRFGGPSKAIAERDIVEKSGDSLRTVRRGIGELEKDGWITVDRSRRPHRIALVEPADIKAAHLAAAN